MKTFTIPANKTEQEYVWSTNYINANIAELQKHLLPFTDKVEDVTYHNDECASIAVNLNGVGYQIFLPNTFHIGEATLDDFMNENNEFPFYNLIKDEEYAFEKTFSKTFRDLESLAQFLKKLQTKTQGIAKKSKSTIVSLSTDDAINELYDHLLIHEGIVVYPYGDTEAPLYAINDGKKYVMLIDRDYLYLNSISQIVMVAECYYTTEDIVQVRNLF